MTIQPLDGKPMMVSFFDASLGTSKQGRAQQGEIHLLTSTNTMTKPSVSNILEFHSNKIQRVVRSSLAAEGCAMSSAGDKQLFNRVILDVFLYGKLDLSSSWRQELVTPGCLITDAKGLHDHLHKTGGTASEKQAALDMMLMKQQIEEGTIGLKWTPTWKQVADPLTKDMSVTLLEDLKKINKVCLIQTPDDEAEEQRRAGLRKAQRERRKSRMKEQQQHHPFGM